MMAGAVVGACRASGWALDVQPKLLGAIFSALFNFDEDFRTLPAATIDAVAATFPNAEERREIVDLMLILLKDNHAHTNAGTTVPSSGASCD